MNFRELIEIKYKGIEKDTIIYYPEIKDFCGYKYPNHPNGCPNKIKCQNLKVPYFGEILKNGDYTYFYLVYLIFDFKKYKELRKIENPEFFNSEERVKCLIYWQNSLKLIIKRDIEKLWNNNNISFYVLGCGSVFKLNFQSQVASMEKVCINVFSTMKLNGIKFEVKPKNRIVLCNLLCSKGEINFKIKKEKTLLDYIRK